VPHENRVNSQWRDGCILVASDRLFGKLRWSDIRIHDAPDDARIPPEAWAAVTRYGGIYCNTRRTGTPAEWAYVVAHCLLHLCFGHFRFAAEDSREWNFAADGTVTRFLEGIGFGTQPREYAFDYLPGDEQSAYAELRLRGGVPGEYQADMLRAESRYSREPNFPAIFGRALRQAVTESVRIAAGVDPSAAAQESGPGSIASQAKQWFMTNYPLIGSVVASFKIIDDLEVCRAHDIQIAAVNPSLRELYINPVADLSLAEMKFVMAHEVLHAALRHDQRQETRDPFLFNVACDYAINGWLVEMQLGQAPPGLLHDPELRGLSSEEIYDRITRDLRARRKLRRSRTLAGGGKPDIVGAKMPGWWTRGDGVTLDEFYRSALAQGLELHLTQHGRGLLPGNLMEEIRAQAMPPIPWDVKLGRWLDEFFPIPEYRRTYGRPSRRQSATPDIPRPNVIPAEGWDEGRTFGVVLDTSGSMDSVLLARGLGSIAAYCASREIPAVRLVGCDAAAWDYGYVAAEEVADRIAIRGRGGTVLQPGVDTLVRSDDFPPDAPVLVITDTWCEDKLSIPREHAFLIPSGQRLPFPPLGPVFTMAPPKTA
jgi:predicted metal-dependent peptidase